MSGTTLLGTMLLGTGETLSDSLTNGRLLYNGFDLDYTNVRLTYLSDLFDLGEYTFTQYESIRTDGRTFGSFNLEKKLITARGVIKGTSESDLEDNINEMKGYLLKNNQNLQYEKADGNILHTTASVVSLKFDRQYYHVTFCPFTVVFETIDPFLYDATIVEEAFEGESSNISTSIVNTSGCYKARPFIVFNFLTGLSSVDTIDVTIGDQSLSITGPFVDNDQVLINCSAKYVMVNGTIDETSFTGNFPVVEWGSNDVEIDIDGTWNADIYILYYPTYA